MKTRSQAGRQTRAAAAAAGRDADGDGRRTLAWELRPFGRGPIYNLPVIIIAIVFIVIFAILTELPLWMVGLAAILAVIGYLLERRRPS